MKKSKVGKRLGKRGRERERATERDRERQRERQTERERERDREREREREKKKKKKRRRKQKVKSRSQRGKSDGFAETQNSLESEIFHTILVCLLRIRFICSSLNQTSAHIAAALLGKVVGTGCLLLLVQQSETISCC